MEQKNQPSSQSEVPDGFSETSENLFRIEAIRDWRGRPVGSPLSIYWRWVSFIAVVSLLIFASLISIGIFMEYAPVLRAPGKIEIRSGVSRMTSPISGTIRKIGVVPGQRVKKGQELLVINRDIWVSGSKTLKANSKIQYEKELAVIQSEILNLQRDEAQKISSVRARIGSIEAEIPAMERDVQSQKRIVAAMSEQFSMIRDYANKGFASEMQVKDKEVQLENAKSRLNSSESSLIRLKRDLEDSTNSIAAIQNQSQSAQVSLRKEMTRINGSIEREDATEATVISTVDGVVDNIVPTVGQSVEQGQILLSVTPDASGSQNFFAKVYINSRIAAVAKNEKTIYLALHAYPSDKYGYIEGKIVNIAPSATPEQMLYQDTGIQNAGITFLALVEITSIPKGDNGVAELELKAGMTLDGLVPLEKRSVIGWIIEPLTRETR